jgi:HSP20 family protein
MTTLAQWDPFRDLLSIHGQLNRLFGEASAGAEVGRGGSWLPALDIHEAKDRFVVAVELPGIDPKDVDVSVEDSTLTVRGERRFSEELDDENYHRVERRYGSFSRSLTLPKAADAEKIEALFDKGVLRIEVPKVEAATPKKITVKASA